MISSIIQILLLYYSMEESTFEVSRSDICTDTFLFELSGYISLYILFEHVSNTEHALSTWFVIE